MVVVGGEVYIEPEMSTRESGYQCTAELSLTTVTVVGTGLVVVTGIVEVTGGWVTTTVVVTGLVTVVESVTMVVTVRVWPCLSSEPPISTEAQPGESNSRGGRIGDGVAARNRNYKSSECNIDISKGGDAREHDRQRARGFVG